MTYTIKSHHGHIIKSGISDPYCAKLDARVHTIGMGGDIAYVWRLSDSGEESCIGFADRGYWNSYQTDIRVSD